MSKGKKPKPQKAATPGKKAAPSKPRPPAGERRRDIAGDVVHPVRTIPKIPGDDALARIAHARLLLVQMLEVLKPVLLGGLTTRQRASLVRRRRAGVTVLPDLLALVADRPALAPNGTPADAVLDKSKIHAAFAEFADRVDGFAKDVSDTQLLRKIELYKLGLDIYSIAKRSGIDTQVANVVEQMKAAMKTGLRNPAQEVTMLEKPVKTAEEPKK